jgi:DNA repair exonuclease SbcCD ATPase subunit
VKKVFFKRISVTNFLSVGETPLILDFRSGISLITGENRDEGGRNGVGKSTVVESLYWCLFGNTMREIKRDQIVHDQCDGSSNVVLEFDVISSDKTDSYVLSRFINPNKVSLTCNEVDITRSSMPKTDDLIKEIIGATEEVFQNAVIMSANNTLPFMAQKKVDKRKFVEGILRLGIFGEMLLQIRSDYNENKKAYDLTLSQFSEKQKNLSVFQQQYEKTELSKKTKIQQLQDKIKGNFSRIEEISNYSNVEDNIKNLDEEIFKKEKAIKKLEELLKDCESKSMSFWKEKQELEIQISQVQKEIKSLESSQAFCPLCKRDYEDYNKSHIECVTEKTKQTEKDLKKLFKKIEKDLSDQSKSCSKISDTKSKVEKEIKQDIQKKQSLALISQEITQLKNRNLEIEKEIQDISAIDNDFTPLIEQTNKEITLIEEEINKLNKKINILESAKYIVSEEGVKTFIVKKMLNVLNSRLNFYLQAMDAPCKCMFNEMFEETIYNKNNKECSYFNFSGGERKRIDLAILFMFQDLLRNQSGTSFSLSIYDELFDSALDEKGVDKILTVLAERVKKYGENIYIISHNKAAIKSNIDQVILLQKLNGKTTILQ